jgi:hypothetical protein
MDNDFLDKLFALLQIPDEETKQFHNDFQEIISCNVLTTLLDILPNDKKESFAALIKNGKTDHDSINKWVESQNIKDEGLAEKLNAAIEKSYDDFFDALTHDLDEDKKSEIREFARSYLNG